MRAKFEGTPRPHYDPYDWDRDRVDEQCEHLRLAEQFGSLIPGERKSFHSLIAGAIPYAEQLELDLTASDHRAAIRLQLARKIEEEVFPLTRPRWLDAYPLRLRSARLRGCYGYSLSASKWVVMWDDKAGLSRLCPDDAREEAMRLRRRVQGKLEELQAAGRTLTYAVFTLPNFAPGKLRAGMAQIFKRFKALLKRTDAIEGSLAVLEAPLGQSRDWNVHLNVIAVTRGLLDYKRIRALWHWNVEFRKLSNAPGAIGGALTELIKYAVAATSAKSHDAAHSRAPPMLEWSGPELAEWLHAFHGFRRTRTYGELYGLPPPPKEDLNPIAWVGQVSYERGRYVQRLHLLDSIQEDKSTPGATPLQRFVAGLKRNRDAADRWEAVERDYPSAFRPASQRDDLLIK